MWLVVLVHRNKARSKLNEFSVPRRVCEWHPLASENSQPLLFQTYVSTPLQRQFVSGQSMSGQLVAVRALERGDRGHVPADQSAASAGHPADCPRGAGGADGSQSAP